MTCIPLADRRPGEYPPEELPHGWANAEVTFVRLDGEVVKRIDILDCRHQPPTRYQQEPMAMIAFKCFGLFLAVLPVYFLLYTVLHLIRLPIVSIVNGSLNAFGKQLWAIVRIPFYFFALEYAALFGIFKPLEGRALFASFETDLHDGKNRYAAFQYEKGDFDTWGEIWEVFSLEEYPHPFFVAICMQPLGKTDASHVRGYQFVTAQNSPAS